jgi:hypothetical protein
MKTIKCKNCKADVFVSGDVKEALCSSCVIVQDFKLFGLPKGVEKAQKKTNEVKYPRGWHFMKEFVSSDGKVFYRGVEQEDLFGTKSSTIIKEESTKPKMSKFEKEEKFRDLSQQVEIIRKKMIKLESQANKRNKTEIKKLNREFAQLKKQRKKYI